MPPVVRRIQYCSSEVGGHPFDPPIALGVVLADNTYETLIHSGVEIKRGALGGASKYTIGMSAPTSRTS